jgi:hypothetical protein
MPLTGPALFEALQAASGRPIAVPLTSGQSREVARVLPIADTHQIRALWPPWSNDPPQPGARVLWDPQWDSGVWCEPAARAKVLLALEGVEAETEPP